MSQSDLLVAVVLTYRKPDDTLKCVDSLRASSRAPDRIIVVDNGSGGGTAEKLRRDLGGEVGVDLVVHEKNLGFAAGVNSGIAAARTVGASWVLLVNDDAVVEPSSIKRLLAACQDPRVAASGPTICFASTPEVIWQAGGEFSRFRMGVRSRLKNQPIRKAPPVPQSVTFLTGCVLLLRAAVLDEIGGLDEQMFLYEEDADLSVRIVQAGYRMMYVPDALAWHAIGTQGATRSTPFVLYHAARSRVLLIFKHSTGLHRGLGLLVHLCVYTPERVLRVLKNSRDLRAIVGWIRGTLDGVRTAVSQEHEGQ